MKKIITLFCLILLSGCMGMPKGVTPVKDFEANKYLGTWYEIARLDHSFERGLSHVTADYSMREDGGIKVTNRGFSSKTSQFEEAIGKAYFVDSPKEGYLKVSFFGPFYGSYVVFELDKSNYQYSFVSGNDLSSLWLLSRTPQVSPEIVDKFKTSAKALGFDTDKLIMVEQKK